jgi:hypothetical protein
VSANNSNLATAIAQLTASSTAQASALAIHKSTAIAAATFAIATGCTYINHPNPVWVPSEWLGLAGLGAALIYGGGPVLARPFAIQQAAAMNLATVALGNIGVGAQAALPG